MTPETREELEEALQCLYDAESKLRRYGKVNHSSIKNARKRLERVLHPQEEVE